MSPRSLTRLLTLLAAAVAVVSIWLLGHMQRDTATDSFARTEAAQQMLAAVETRNRPLYDRQAARLLGSTTLDSAGGHELIGAHVQLGNDVMALAARAEAGRLPQADAVRRTMLTDTFRETNAEVVEHLRKRGSGDLDYAGLIAIALILDVVALFGLIAWRTVGRRAEVRARRHEEETAQREQQVTFAQSLQYVETEEAAAMLVRLHLEQVVPGSRVSVLGPDERAAELSEFALSMPLLTHGNVVGSVLVECDAPVAEHARGCVVETVAHAAAVVANLRALAGAEERAAIDTLTDLPNRGATQDTLRRMMAQANRSEHALSAVTLDLDHFRQINERFGREKGDEILAAAADVLVGTLRASDFAGRQGGEEFVVLLPDTGLDGAIVAAEKLRQAIASISVDGVDQAVTASFGIAVYPTDAPDPETLLRNTERALGAAKSAGRNCVEAWALNVTPEGETPLAVVSPETAA